MNTEFKEQFISQCPECLWVECTSEKYRSKYIKSGMKIRNLLEKKCWKCQTKK